jgi:deoxyribose-phosphate aldolase
MRLTRAELAARIDHTLLRPTATAAQVEQLCREAHAAGFCSVCVHPCFVALARRTLGALGSKVLVCTVVGFPLGANTTLIKASEGALARVEGADELDMVIALHALRAGDDEYVQRDISEVVRTAGGLVVKVIIETALLEPAEIDRASRVAVAAGAHFVKTSTGFGPGGATAEAVRRIRAAVGPEPGVKASGGIADAAAARAMIEAGATRIGASASLAIVAGWDEDVPLSMSEGSGG